jgi:diguanylate cyclase (GGDEF)-like protein
VTLTMIDVAGLRSLNRRFGHARGDLVLALTAQAARSSELPAACIARVGSDEFALLELGRSPEQARRDAAALAGRLTETSRLVGCVVGYRVVCAHSELPPLSLDDLMTYAEEQLDRAASGSPASSTGVVFAMYPEAPEEAAEGRAPRGVA